MKYHQWSLYQYLPSMELQDTQENLIPQKGMGNRRSLFYQMKSIHLYQPIKTVKLKSITQVHFTVTIEGKKLGPTINRHLPPLCWAAVNYKCHSHVHGTYIASHCSITEIKLIEDPLLVTIWLSMQELINWFRSFPGFYRLGGEGGEGEDSPQILQLPP